MSRLLPKFLPVAALTIAAGFAPTFATFHLMAVQEVFPGTAEAPQAQYVVLRMTSSGQEFVSGTYLDVQDASGATLGRFGTFDHNVANAGTVSCSYPTCPAIVIGTSAAQALLGFSFDQIVDSQTGHVALPVSGGRICFRSSAGAAVDCVAWGAFAAANTIPTPTINGCDANMGTPAVALAQDFALTRILFNCGAKTNATDFALRFPHPVANNGANANTDADGDGLIQPLDCNDGDSNAWYAPSEVTGLLAGPGAPTTLSWEPQAARAGTGVSYDVVVGAVGDLIAVRSYASAMCGAADVPAAKHDDLSPDPPAGQARYYLVRASSSCGNATFGDSTLTPDPRDGLDGGSPCP